MSWLVKEILLVSLGLPLFLQSIIYAWEDRVRFELCLMLAISEAEM